MQSFLVVIQSMTPNQGFEKKNAIYIAIYIAYTFSYPFPKKDFLHFRFRIRFPKKNFGVFVSVFHIAVPFSVPYSQKIGRTKTMYEKPYLPQKIQNRFIYFFVFIFCSI